MSDSDYYVADEAFVEDSFVESADDFVEPTVEEVEVIE